MTGAQDHLAISELLVPEPAIGLARLLEVDVPAQTLPPLWHWTYLLERRQHGELGADGHPTSGIPAPPAPGLRRMFAGGRVTTHRELRIGELATRYTRVVSTVGKQGRSGPMTFVTVRSEVSQQGHIAVVDENDIVYLPSDSPRRDSVEPASRVRGREPRLSLTVDEAFLFRFSALTFNAHRIHYDHRWARNEGYADLVVHGPLQALMMAELHRRAGHSLSGRVFKYRLVAPMIGPQTFDVLAHEDGLGTGAEVRDASGTVTAVSHGAAP